MDRLNEIITRFYEANPYHGPISVLDTETTGLEKNARIIELGCITAHYDGFEVHIDTFESLINPGFPVSDKITEITHITNDELKNAPGDEVYEQFYTWFKKYNPVFIGAHNAIFDKGKLLYNLERVGCKLAYEMPEFVCTMQMAKKLLVGPKNDKLSTLGEWYNFENRNAHRALTDVEVTAYILFKMKLNEFK